MSTASPTLAVLAEMAQRIRPRRLRTIREFAEQEIILPNGVREGSRFRVDTNPHVGLWFDAIDSGRFRRHFALGPTGSGKTLCASFIPLLWHLFERREPVIFGLPDANMVKDKWAGEILPVIASSRYRDMLPTSGAGSRGGDVERIDFKHGPFVRFMTGGGGDKSRAGMHVRVLIATEVDGFDKISEASRESDQFTQLEARVSSRSDSVVYGECTVSTEDGRTHQEYTNGTASRIVMHCPHCLAWVTPERQHLVGWKDAKDEISAMEGARIVCPECGALWTEQERMAAARENKLVHHGEIITPDGSIIGEARRTLTLGFRWTASNNLLKPIGETALLEWKASRSPTPDIVEKGLRQFCWALPHVADAKEVNKLSFHDIAARVMQGVLWGLLADDTQDLTVGVDVGKYTLHWSAVGWRRVAAEAAEIMQGATGGGGITPQLPEYGRMEVPSNEMGEELALRMTLRRLRDEVLINGWRRVGGGDPVKPLVITVDAGYQQAIVMDFVAESEALGLPVKAVKGLGERQFGAGAASGGIGASGDRPKGSRLVANGPGWEAWELPGEPTLLIEANADHWKSYLHARLATPAGKVGGLVLAMPPSGSPTQHLSFARHMVAEKKIEEFKAGVGGRGLITRWQKVARDNHWLDATALASLGRSLAGEQVLPVGDTSKAPSTAAPVARYPEENERSSWMPPRPEKWVR